MNSTFRLLSILVILPMLGMAQQQPWENNGRLDNIAELSTVVTVPVIMPDGIKLYTDVYQPMLGDCLMVPLEIPNIGTFELELIKKGTQLFIYDSINGQPNPNPYQLPMVLSRTPYDKGDGTNGEGAAIAFLGYNYAIQDMRGRYTSEGVYLPLLSDSYNKNPYHGNWQHVLDETDPSDPKNGNKHEDGYNTIQYIVNDLKKEFDLDSDGITDTVDLWTTGRIAMIGASALGYNQYQAASAHKIDPSEPGLKAIMPIVAPGEFYKSTGFGNGVLRDRLVTGWLKGQIFTGTEDDLIPEDEAIAAQYGVDSAMHNSIHTSFDYDLPKTIAFNGVPRTYQENKFDAANLAIDHFCSMRYPDESGNLGPAAYYPNAAGRAEMDISRARVDNNGEGMLNGPKDRYSNMDVPGYHLTGWWDIFIDGQIETWARMRENIDPASGNNKLQKIVIGPWAHQTIGAFETGDRTYPANVMELIGINFDNFDGDIPLTEFLRSELIAWFRYHLNYHPSAYIGEPKAIIPESQDWQDVNIPLIGNAQIRVPATEVRMTYNDLLAFLNGSGGISQLPIEIQSPSLNDTLYYDVDPSGVSFVESWPTGSIAEVQNRDFADESDIANVRLYVIGPNNDSIVENQSLGNYWFAADTFPLQEPYVEMENWYLHQNGTVNMTAPTVDEGFNVYVHDPDDPIRCIGGANMIVHTPDGERDSQGQFNLKDPRYAAYTIDRPGVLEYTSEAVTEDSLCVIGFPVATLYAKSNPGGALLGPTDTDFFVRIIDVYPDGREYFVTEGCVNARARKYVKAMVEEPEKELNYPFEIDSIPFENIEIGKVLEYKFKMLPLAYTFGKGHKVKFLISSSLYTRWQVNPNLPINDGEFFRRKPGDGRKYVFDGVEMAPRVAVQRVAFSPDYPTNISMPIYQNNYTTSTDEVQDAPQLDMAIYPNPADDILNVYLASPSNYSISIFTATGALVQTSTANGELNALDVSNLSSGVYLLEVIDNKSGEKRSERFNKK